MSTKYLYIYTIGCQMNVYDSDKIASVLKPFEYQITPFPDNADLIIVNTCSIREKAQEKAFSFLGRVADLKKQNKNLIIGIGGCVAQQEGKNILKRAPYTDLVFGTHAIERLVENIKKIQNQKQKIVDIEKREFIFEPKTELECLERNKISSFVTIMQGCDNFCTYCVVPYVRGREMSREPQNIIAEIENLVQKGTREVTLLGQNVNSYGKKENLPSFPELLYLINDIKDLLRIRFATSHPKDLSDDLIMAFKNIDKLCNHIHLPVQSGSNNILKKMNRKYTKEKYIERIDKLRQICPDMSVSSDMIVGFPGETKEDFNETLDLMKKVEFDGLFAFIYSDRSHAPASEFKNKIPENEKKERLQKILELQDKYTQRKNDQYIGKTVEVLVEGKSKKQKNNSENIQWTGRTFDNKIVNFINSESINDLTAIMLEIKIEKSFPHSLWGTI